MRLAQALKSALRKVKSSPQANRRPLDFSKNETREIVRLSDAVCEIPETRWVQQEATALSVGEASCTTVERQRRGQMARASIDSQLSHLCSHSS